MPLICRRLSSCSSSVMCPFPTTEEREATLPRLDRRPMAETLVRRLEEDPAGLFKAAVEDECSSPRSVSSCSIRWSSILASSSCKYLCCFFHGGMKLLIWLGQSSQPVLSNWMPIFSKRLLHAFVSEGGSAVGVVFASRNGFWSVPKAVGPNRKNCSSFCQPSAPKEFGCADGCVFASSFQ